MCILSVTKMAKVPKSKPKGVSMSSATMLIFKNDGLCGQIKQHVFRYEIENRGSMHVHVIFWVEKDDVEQVANKISAHIPREDPSNIETNRLRELVVSKQIHKCQKSCKSMKGRTDLCKYGFPFECQTSSSPILCSKTHRWLYYLPTSEHQNVVPYHPSMLLAWGAHMNIQQVAHSSISFYLPKYAMKTKPMGHLNIKPQDVARLGLKGPTLARIEKTCVDRTCKGYTSPPLFHLRMPYFH